MSTLPPALPTQSLLTRFWPTNTTRAERSSLIAGALGWMLDAMDVMLYSLVLAYLIREFSMSTRTAGLLNSLTRIASAIGGLIFGVAPDRSGRRRSRMASFPSAARDFSLSSRSRHGRRMEPRCRSDRRNVAPRTPRQSLGTHAVFLRNR